MDADPMAGQLFPWIGNIPTVTVHHLHVLVEDIEPIKAAYEKGVAGVERIEVHDVRRFNGLLALMVTAKPVSVEYLQVTDPEVGVARMLKDEPLGLNAVDFLVPDAEEAISAARAAGYIVTGRMSIYNCQEIWLRHPDLSLNIEFMVAPPPGYLPGSGPEADKPQVHIYGLDGTENLYFE
jgi:hypothetical protein